LQKATADKVAAWMVRELEDAGYLDQSSAAQRIREQFGDAFVYETLSGKLAISMSVLRAFGERSGDDVIWELGGTAWRKASRHRR
jgi:hypothetical protein